MHFKQKNALREILYFETTFLKLLISRKDNVSDRFALLLDLYLLSKSRYVINFYYLNFSITIPNIFTVEITWIVGWIFRMFRFLTKWTSKRNTCPKLWQSTLNLCVRICFGCITMVIVNFTTMLHLLFYSCPRDSEFPWQEQ